MTFEEWWKKNGRRMAPKAWAKFAWETSAILNHPSNNMTEEQWEKIEEYIKKMKDETGI